MTCTFSCTQTDVNWFHQNEFEPKISQLKKEIIKMLRLLIDSGYTDFYVNCEYGIPLWTAELICLLKKTDQIFLHIAVPYEEQCSNWPEAFRDRYFRLHTLADTVTFVNKQYAKDCYQKTDAFMADKSNLIVVFGNPVNKSYIAEYSQNTGITAEFVMIDIT